jgi:hypothetical protein
LTLIAFTIGITTLTIQMAIRVSIPRPKTNIKGMESRLYKIRLN